MSVNKLRLSVSYTYTKFTCQGAASAVIQANEESTMQNQSETENLIKSRELELSELKEAYKEKHRKCQAWEKVQSHQ